mgnify:CR=1 FL=1
MKELDILKVLKTKSKCKRRQVGCVITKEGFILGTGYNKPFIGLHKCCRRCHSNSGEDIANCNALHAEQMAIIEAGKKGCFGATMYVSTFPCEICAKMIIFAGIKKIKFIQTYPAMLDQVKLFTEYGIELEQIDENEVKIEDDVEYIE